MKIPYKCKVCELNKTIGKRLIKVNIYVCVYKVRYKDMFVSVLNFQTIVLDFNDIHLMPF
jgi:hypothetical protein